MLKSGLAIWCYTPPGQTYYGVAQVDYSRYVENLRFTTVAPGGFGQLTCQLRLTQPRIPRPELALFSRIVVMAPTSNDASRAVFIGEITQPELSMDQNGEYYTIQALGIGNCLRDDPRNVNYSGTAQQIITTEMTVNNRSAWMPISTDQSGVFPDNPSATLKPSYMGYAMEDILNDVCVLSGDYQWGVWAHESQKDSYGFPLGQLLVHLRNTTTIDYIAELVTGDIYSWKITPAADRAYNAMTICYTDRDNSNTYATRTTVDSRLSGTFQQQSAPFRYRKYFQDFSGIQTINLAQATSIENTQLAIFKNPTNKIQVVLRSVRNSNGLPMPLWDMQADNNIQIPELAQRGLQIPVAATPTINMFYILSTEYAEDSSGTMQQTIQCDNWFDYAQTRLARLELAAYRQAMNGTKPSRTQALGSPDYGKTGMQTDASFAGENLSYATTFHANLVQTPTSISLSADVTLNETGVTTTSVGPHGFTLTWSSVAAGQSAWIGTYTTVGNCLLAVDLEAGTVDHHCEKCGMVRTALPILEHVRIETPHPELAKRHLPGNYGLNIDCPTCGATESFTTSLLEADEQEHDYNPASRAEMARLIRKLQTHKPLQSALMVKAASVRTA